MKEESYTSTAPMGRTACTEPQCLYKGAIYILTNARNIKHVSMLYACSILNCIKIGRKLQKIQGKNFILPVVIGVNDLVIHAYFMRLFPI